MDFDYLSLQERTAFDVLWNDLKWREQISTLTHPWVLVRTAKLALERKSLPTKGIDYFNLYRATMEKIEQVIEPLQSGRLTDGLFFWTRLDLDLEVKELRAIIREQEELDDIY